MIKQCNYIMFKNGNIVLVDNLSNILHFEVYTFSNILVKTQFFKSFSKPAKTSVVECFHKKLWCFFDPL